MAAVSYLSGLPFVADVGMVGVCTSGGNAVYLAARDARIKAVATVAAMLPDPPLFARIYGDEGLAARRHQAAAARRTYEATGTATTIPTYSETNPDAATSRRRRGRTTTT